MWVLVDLGIYQGAEELKINPMTLINNLNRAIRSNSSTILSVAAIAGTVGTAVLAAKASFEAAKDIQEADPKPETLREKVELVWPHYVPAGVTGVATIASIIGSDRISNKRTAAAVTAYTVAEQAFSEYRHKVIEQIGANKEQNVRDTIAQDVIINNPPGQTVIVGNGTVLCCELMTRRYFMSSMEELLRSKNEINASVINGLYSTLSDFYYLIGLAQTSHSSEIGWDSDKLMDLEFSTVLTEDGRPCLAFTYNYTKPI
jgi:Family of unknown function (DUF6353)